MSVTLLIGSWRLRTAMTWLCHRPTMQIVPLAALGVRTGLGWGTPYWSTVAVWPVTTLLLIATYLGSRIHAELDDAGLPCRWCDAGYELADEEGW
jgi:hypothetical protein